MCLHFTFLGPGKESIGASDGRMVGMAIGRLDWSEERWAISLASSSDNHQRIFKKKKKKTLESVLLLWPEALCVSSLNFLDTPVICIVSASLTI